MNFAAGGPASVMIEKFAISGGTVLSEFLDLNHTSKAMILVPLLIPKFARDTSAEMWRTSESGHYEPVRLTLATPRLLSTVWARRFCDQHEMSLQTATGRSLPYEIVRIRAGLTPLRAR